MDEKGGIEMKVIYSQPDRPIYIVKIDDYDYAMVNPFKEAKNKVKHSVTPQTFLKWCSFIECIQVPEKTMWAIEKAIQEDPDELHWNERKAEQIEKWKEVLAKKRANYKYICLLKKGGGNKDMDERKGGLQPDGSWLMIDDPKPYKVPEEETKKEDKPKFEFKRNDKNRIEAVYDDGHVSEIGVMGDFAGFTDGFPYTPEEYLTYGLSPKEAEALLNGKSGRDQLIELEGQKGYEALIKEGAIKDPTYK